jgi:2-amino-4-hydroxy-6-hydroxymethyldihydropteridine diphosphokinase
MAQGKAGGTLHDAGRARAGVNAERRSPNAEASRLAIVALGSNLGAPAETLQSAMAKLEHLAFGPLLRSSLWRSAPVDCPPGSSDFINAVAAFEPVAGETPESLLAKLLAIEDHFGRKRSGVVNEARPLDLDLIAFGDERRDSATLKLPHPRAMTRQFVLAPLAEILPEFQAPGWPATAVELARPADQGLHRCS